jgi:hypothetical protein
MFVPCSEISSTRVGLDFWNFLFVIQEQEGFQISSMRMGFWSLVGRKWLEGRILWVLSCVLSANQESEMIVSVFYEKIPLISIQGRIRTRQISNIFREIKPNWIFRSTKKKRQKRRKDILGASINLCFLGKISPNSNMKNMISTYTKDFFSVKKRLKVGRFWEKKILIARFLW